MENDLTPIHQRVSTRPFSLGEAWKQAYYANPLDHPCRQKSCSKSSLPGAVKYVGEQKLDSPNVLLTEAVKVYISPTESPSIRYSTLVLSP